MVPFTQEQLAAARLLYTELGPTVFSDLTAQLRNESTSTSIDQTATAAYRAVTHAVTPTPQVPRKDAGLAHQADQSCCKIPHGHDVMGGKIPTVKSVFGAERKRKKFHPYPCPGTFSPGGQIACENDPKPFKYNGHWTKHFIKWDIESYELASPHKTKKYRCVYGCERLFKEDMTLMEHIWKDHMLIWTSPHGQTQRLPNPVAPSIAPSIDTVAAQSAQLLTDEAIHEIHEVLIATDKGNDHAALATGAGPAANMMPADATLAFIAAHAWTDNVFHALLCGSSIPSSYMSSGTSSAMSQQGPVMSSLTSDELCNCSDLKIHASDLHFDIDNQDFSFDDPLQALGFDPTASVKPSP